MSGQAEAVKRKTRACLRARGAARRALKQAMPIFEVMREGCVEMLSDAAQKLRRNGYRWMYSNRIDEIAYGSLTDARLQALMESNHTASDLLYCACEEADPLLCRNALESAWVELQKRIV